MSLKSVPFSHPHFPTPGDFSAPLRNPFLLPHRNLQIRKRRRLKLLNRPGPPPVAASFDHLFHNLVSIFPSVSSLDLVAPLLGLASGAAFLYSASAHHGPRLPGGDPEVVGDWILFTSPTPFNRCVLLRCPSVSFDDGGELLEGVNDRLVREERHYVNLSRGRIPADCGDGGAAGDEVSYQRVCVGTDDGGVISLDWPDNLDLGKEQGLDTTVLLVPGTTEGSLDGNVRALVYEVLRHGCFPIVMNPRGCAGSPLTTPRLFSAADSDDICTAIQFISKSRPWTTLMSIGWGYGANMLAKYLAEVGERTPLTAAVCIDNPFDLDEATKSFPHNVALDKKLKGGLINILQANKELFQGKTKGFNVAEALSATSVRDFEGAVSMVSYGFEAIKDFYSSSSTRQLVSRVKIPLLFIQSDDGTVPLFSIPRSSIAENPFTSLLLCSCLPSNVIKSERSAIIWCQHIVIEWLSAVELALLKGRHPLLKDVDITITPPKGLALVDRRVSDKSTSIGGKIYTDYGSADSYVSHKDEKREHFSKLADANAGSEVLVDPIRMILEGNDSAAPKEAGDLETVGKKQSSDSDVLQQSGSVDVGLTKEGGDSSIDNEKSQVLETVTVVLNMLDVTIPGTLGDEQKKKVLAAMEQGETLMRALQGAVPEDVRGKLTTAVSEIVQTQGTNLNLDRLKKIGWIPNMMLNMKSKNQEKSKVISTTEGGLDHNNSTEHRNNAFGNEAREHDDSHFLHPNDDIAQENSRASQEKAPPTSGDVETGSEDEGKPGLPSKTEKVIGVMEAVDDQDKVSWSHRIADGNENGHVSFKDANDIHKSETTNFEESCASGSSSVENQPLQKEGSDIKKNEDNNSQDKVDQNGQNSPTKSEEPSSHAASTNPPSISVSQALDALTGFDDSTQMAVNSVFGVIENMIDQLEKGNDKKIDGEEGKDEVQESDCASEESPTSSNYKSERHECSDGVKSSGQPVTDALGNIFDSHQDIGVNWGENKLSYDHSIYANSGFGRFPGNNTSVGDLLMEDSNKVGSVQKFPLEFNINPYWESPYIAYLCKYFLLQISKQSLDSQSATDLFLDPEEGRWKMLDQMENDTDEHQNINRSQTIRSPLQESDSDRENIIEPSYKILDTERSRLEPQSRHGKLNNNDKQYVLNDARKEQLICLVKNTLLDALKVEVGRRLGTADMKERESNIMNDLELVADTVTHAALHGSELMLSFESKDSASVKFGTIQGQQVAKTISYIVNDTRYIGKVLPVGVILGITLASLRKYFHVAALHDDDQGEVTTDRSVNLQEKHDDQESYIRNSDHGVGEKDQDRDLDSSWQRGTKEIETVEPRNGNVMVGAVRNSDHGVGEKDLDRDLDSSWQRGTKEIETVEPRNDNVMVGAVTAALGASALLAHHQRKKVHNSVESAGVLSGAIKTGVDSLKMHDKLEDEMQEKTENNLVSTLAEKAMSVAGPVLPTNTDGEVDHERLVTVLAELGQKGGILRLIGKVALLWGGIRGAMSLTDKLISFLRIAERPLLQRILGFLSMALVLWSPVVVPLLPTLVQSWTTKSATGIAGYACIIGLYVSITILVTLWGKRIRGYENPLKQYGLDLTLPSKEHDILKGFIGGSMLVLCIHLINAAFGYASFAWPSSLPSSSAGAVVLLKTYGTMLVLSIRGILTAIGISIVEELVFRSWLPEEIATDLGYQQAIIISGLAFSLLQRSLSSVPGFLFLSLALFGAKQRAHGSLYLPIGTRTGIMTVNFVLQTGNFLNYRSSTPFWLASAHPWHPFDGAVGLGICVILAIFLYPRQGKKNNPRIIGE